jgi:hypothetical protein
VRYRDPRALAAQASTVLALLAWEGHSAAEKAQAAYDAGMRTYLGDQAAHPLPPRERCPLTTFDAALRALSEASATVKKQLIAACTACVLYDRQVTVHERELLRAIGATLDCPLPPLVVEARAG